MHRFHKLLFRNFSFTGICNTNKVIRLKEFNDLGDYYLIEIQYSNFVIIQVGSKELKLELLNK